MSFSAGPEIKQLESKPNACMKSALQVETACYTTVLASSDSSPEHEFLSGHPHMSALFRMKLLPLLLLWHVGCIKEALARGQSDGITRSWTAYLQNCELGNLFSF